MGPYEMSWDDLEKMKHCLTCKYYSLAEAWGNSDLFLYCGFFKDEVNNRGTCEHYETLPL